MQFSAKRDLLLNSLSLAQGIIEKKKYIRNFIKYSYPNKRE